MTTDDVPDPRTDRIIEVAMLLAEADGYENVRLRDLAAQADVALGTVYRRFSSKEDILAAALERMVSSLRGALLDAPVPGDTPLERLGVFLELATSALGERPKLAAALFRTVASGDPDLAQRVLSYRDTMTELIVAVLRADPHPGPPSDAETAVSRFIQNMWFAEMVGWTGGLHPIEDALRHTREAAARLLALPETP